MPLANPMSAKPVTSHRFLDEAGDTTFYGKGLVPSIGEAGVSLSFGIGMVKFNGDLNEARRAIQKMQADVLADDYLKTIPSIAKKAAGKGYYFHATDDPPEVRERFFKFIRAIDCTCEVTVARKIPSMFALKHHHREAEFYTDVLSHLLKDKLRPGEKIVLNIAERGPSTRNANLQLALTKAAERFERKWTAEEISSLVVFNVQNHHTEPLLNVADYLCWSVQRVFERGETRYYDFLGDRIRLVVDLYDTAGYEGSLNHYCDQHRLTAANKISPPTP